MASQITAWNADRIGSLIQARLIKNAEAAGKYLVKQVKRKISVQGPPPSLPHSYPHMESGDLHNSIMYEVAPTARGSISLTVGSPLFYARILEEGSSQMAPRVFLRNTLAEEGRTVARIMAGKA